MIDDHSPVPADDHGVRPGRGHARRRGRPRRRRPTARARPGRLSVELLQVRLSSYLGCAVCDLPQARAAAAGGLAGVRVRAVPRVGLTGTLLDWAPRTSPSPAGSRPTPISRRADVGAGACRAARGPRGGGRSADAGAAQRRRRAAAGRRRTRRRGRQDGAGLPHRTRTSRSASASRRRTARWTATGRCAGAARRCATCCSATRWAAARTSACRWGGRQARPPSAATATPRSAALPEAGEGPPTSGRRGERAPPGRGVPAAGPAQGSVVNTASLQQDQHPTLLRSLLRARLGGWLRRPQDPEV